MKVLPAYLPMYLSSHPETKKLTITINSKRGEKIAHTHTHMKGTKGTFNIVTMSPFLQSMKKEKL
jgi:hypothetical protein